MIFLPVMDLEVIGGKALMILLKHIYLHELQLTVFTSIMYTICNINMAYQICLC